MFALEDLDRSGIPELIIVFFHPHLGGNIYGKIYSYNGSLIYHGIIDIYYMHIYQTGLSSYSGIFAIGGRSSNFSGHYFTIKNNELVHEPLWRQDWSEDEMTIYFNNRELHGMKIFSNNDELVEASFQADESYERDGESGQLIPFNEINRKNIMNIIFGYRLY